MFFLLILKEIKTFLWTPKSTWPPIPEVSAGPGESGLPLSPCPLSGWWPQDFPYLMLPGISQTSGQRRAQNQVLGKIEGDKCSLFRPICPSQRCFRPRRAPFEYEEAWIRPRWPGRQAPVRCLFKGPPWVLTPLLTGLPVAWGLGTNLDHLPSDRNGPSKISQGLNKFFVTRTFSRNR